MRSPDWRIKSFGLLGFLQLQTVQEETAKPGGWFHGRYAYSESVQLCIWRPPACNGHWKAVGFHLEKKMVMEVVNVLPGIM